MSTKTTIKRIALVAVSALGFGMLSGLSTTASAANGSDAASISTDATSYTVVANTGNTDSSTGVIRIALLDSAGSPDSLATTETITATVTGVPAVDTKTVSTNAGDLAFTELTGTPGSYGLDTVVNATNGVFNVTNTPSANNTSTVTTSNVYVLGVSGINSAGGSQTVLDKGFYTVRLRLTDNTGYVLSEKSFKIQFVSSAANTGSSIVLATKGYLTIGETETYTTNRYIKATLTDANGGRIQVASSSLKYPSSTAGAIVTSPTLAVALTNSDGSTVYGAGSHGTDIYASDSGTAGADLSSSATAATSQL